jgi:hypothetical protein
MLNRHQRRQREQVLRTLKVRIAKHGIEPMLDKIFGPGTWRYDAQEQLWIVPDSKDPGPGRAYYCVRANGDWFKARLDREHTQ